VHQQITSQEDAIKTNMQQTIKQYMEEEDQKQALKDEEKEQQENLKEEIKL